MSQTEESLFDKFLSEMDAQINALNSEIQFCETSRKNESKDSNIFKQKLAESQKKFKSDRMSMEKTLKQLNLANEKLKKKKEVCEDELEAFTQECIMQMSNEDNVCVEKPIGSLFESVLESINNLSVKSMDTQLVEIGSKLGILNDEKTSRSQNLKKHNAIITKLESELKSSYDVVYAERNVLKVSMSHQTSSVRQAYQTIRLQEESLKAKLGS